MRLIDAPSKDMADEMKKYLQQVLSKVDGLLCILITDRDGVPVLKVSADSAPELAMRPSFLSTFSMATEQGGKLGLGKNKSLICMYSSYQVVQINKLPLVISFIATSLCNTGHLLSLEHSIEPLLGDLKCAVAD
ncbi:ragulator complex protein LAMTOR3 [Schistocerca piceifrons]|uniref:ragulator complex protein LAMTOR3 n=1 Tax=Schistocerca piceifrons TaxID=274613 RepID=UPI001F5F336B|nr:ragulator complex protein LAMTOR3 [Schistocerca piceifrons]